MIYDDFPYDNFPFRSSHVDVLATVGGLFGLDPAPPEACRVLELGAGMGGNLLGMAVSLPGSRFVGVDLSSQQIAHAQGEVAALGLDNIEFVAADILDLGSDLGRFDYILCHGVWSWVPERVRDAIFRLCRERLTSRGMAFISYNTLPGWHVRGVIRELVQRTTPTGGTPAERAAAARRYLEGLATHAPVARSQVARMIQSEIELIRPLSDSYLFHEHLAEVNHPVWFSDFLAQAEAHELQYVGDAELHAGMPGRYGAQAEMWLKRDQPDFLAMESRFDELGMRFFRRSLLCHREARIDRVLRVERLAGHWFSSTLKPGAVEPGQRTSLSFTAPDGFVVSTTDPLLAAALACLHEEEPRGMPLEVLGAAAAERLGRQKFDDDVRGLGRSLLELVAQNYVEIGRFPPRFVLMAGPYPQTTSLVRREASQAKPGVTNLRHVSVGIDSLERAMLRRMNGTLDRAGLVDAMVGAMERGEFRLSFNAAPVTDRAMLCEIIDVKLERLGRMALLVG